MATYTTSFPTWSGLEALATASDDFESSTTHTLLKDTTTYLAQLMSSSTGWSYSGNSSVITGNHTSGAVLHYYGYNLGTTAAHITGQDITDGTVRIFMSEST